MITRSQTNSEFESIAITDTSGLVIGLDVQQLAVADVANLTIPGGTAGQLLTTDGNGALSWTTAGGATVQVATQATETFTATLQQTLFTLARIPSGTVSGSINGVTAASTAFTVAGDTVTYVPAQNGSYPLKAGDRITLSYLYGSTSATQLGGLADVTITSPVVGDVLTYDAGTSAWVNQSGTAAFGKLVNGTSNVTVETDGVVTVNIDGTANVAIFGNTGMAVSNLAVTGTTASLGDIAGVQIAGGTSGQAIQSLGGGDLAFVNPTRLVTLNFATGSYSFPASYVPTNIIYNSSLYDPQGLYNTTTGRFQPKVAGWYQIYASADTYISPTAETSITITHSTTGQLAAFGGFGLVTTAATGVAYFNGTTDYAFVSVTNQLASTRNQTKARSGFSATYLGL